MAFWIALALIALITGWWMARPFLRRGTLEMDSADSTMSIYRDQLDEIDRDRAAGLISAEESEAARHEIERRALNAARHVDQGIFVGHRSLPAALALTGFAVVAGIGGYLLLGAPQVPDQPLVGRQTELLTQQAAAGDINASIQLLIRSAEDNPDDFETWWLLAKSHAEVGDNASAANAYRRAAELSGDDPSVLSAYAEAMTLANGNKVPTAARVIFEQVLQKQPDARARYYLALAKAQSQDFESAINDWAALAAESNPDAPWMAMVRRDIANMARFMKADVRVYLPDATPAEIAAAGGEAHTADDAEALVGLEEAVDADPTDYNSWLGLARQKAAMGDDEGAVAAIEAGRSHFRAAPFVLAKFDEAARALGLDMLETPKVAGPTTEDIAAVSSLSQEETDDMIAGMVAGLAAKLEENPNNPDGWIMLVRSYANLGQPAKAQAAFEAAMAHYASDNATTARIRAGVEQVIGAN